VPALVQSLEGDRTYTDRLSLLARAHLAVGKVLPSAVPHDAWSDPYFVRAPEPAFPDHIAAARARVAQQPPVITEDKLAVKNPPLRKPRPYLLSPSSALSSRPHFSIFFFDSLACNAYSQAPESRRQKFGRETRALRYVRRHSKWRAVLFAQSRCMHVFFV
jgi:hypothetical protein